MKQRDLSWLLFLATGSAAYTLGQSTDWPNRDRTGTDLLSRDLVGFNLRRADLS